jgi:hypothetical protein
MLLAIWDGDGWERWVALAAVVVGSYLAVLWVAALVWTYRDAASRTRDPVFQAVSVALVLLFNLPGFFIYLILRPKSTLAELYDRQLEAEALLHEIRETPTCPSCRRRIEEEFVACPYCRARLRTPCVSCERTLAATWVVCPYCGADRPSSAPQPAPAAAPVAAAAVDADAPSQPRRPRRPASTATYTPPAASKAPPAADTTPEGV